jgi:hypothetical protein
MGAGMVAQKLNRNTEVTMPSASVQKADSLDQRYFDFTERTSHIFAEFPELEPLRHSIFKDLLIQRRADNGIEIMKHWLRPLVRRSESRGSLNGRRAYLGREPSGCVCGNLRA